MTDDREGRMIEIALKLSRICNVILGVRFTHEPRNVTGTRWAANFDDLDGHHLSIFGAEHK
jgi:hypothetical protein